MASINMLVTSTPDGSATHTHSKTCTPTDTTPPKDVKTTSNTDKVNAPPTYHGRLQGHSLTNANNKSLLQMHLIMATQWQSTSP